MQSLKIVSRLLPEVRTGRKRHTIRWREDKIVPGPMRYINASHPAESVVVWVTDVITLPLSSVAHYLGKQHEWPDRVLLDGMREHYADIQPDSEVDVILHLAPDAKESGQ